LLALDGRRGSAAGQLHDQEAVFRERRNLPAADYLPSVRCNLHAPRVSALVEQRRGRLEKIAPLHRLQSVGVGLLRLGKETYASRDRAQRHDSQGEVAGGQSRRLTDGKLVLHGWFSFMAAACRRFR
jgi:hypothetical protein